MKLTDRSAVQELLTRYGISMKKKYGQNFLVNEAIPRRIAESGADKGCQVLEIGPGIGTMTRELAAIADRVVAVEIDSTLLPVLEETLADYNNVKIVHGDILKTDLDALWQEQFGGSGDLRVCANLPYYVTTPILTYLLESSLPLRSITVMVQKEVADRLCASPGGESYGALSLAVAYRGKAKKCFTVSGGSFFPPPKVDSTVVRIDLFERSPFGLTPVEERIFFRLVRGAFGQRRKTISNALASEFSEFSKEQLQILLTEAGFSPTVRGETLSAADFAALARSFAKEIPASGEIPS